MALLAIITILSTSAISWFSSGPSFIFKLSNALFIVGFIYLCIALSIQVRNLGLFKTLSYHKYLREYKKLAASNLTEYSLMYDKSDKKEPEKFHDFFAKKYAKQVPNALFYLFSIPLLLISLVLSFMIK